MRDAEYLRKRVDERLEEWAGSEEWQGALYAPMSYILRMGGKRIRPVLLLLAYQAVSGKDPEEALDAGCAVEMFHNFTLMHDDIMDNAPVRRGKATVHEHWDVNTAILSGDALYALSMDLLIRNFRDHAYAMSREFSRVALGVCEGQMEDMEMAGEFDSTLSRYVEMIRRKTAMLLGGSLSLGAIAGGAEDTLTAQFYALGEAAGIGFQLQDDYLDAFGTPETFGKQVGGDIVENKMTWLTLKAFELADPEQRKQLHQLIRQDHDPAGKVEAVKRIYEALDIPRLAREEAENWFTRAKDIGDVLSSLPAFEGIVDYLTVILQRNF